MPEKSTHQTGLFDWIPEEARQHARAAHEEIHKSIETLFPPEFNEHTRHAGREILLAWRSLIDAALERTEEHTKKG